MLRYWQKPQSAFLTDIGKNMLELLLIKLFFFYHQMELLDEETEIKEQLARIKEIHIGMPNFIGEQIDKDQDSDEDSENNNYINYNLGTRLAVYEQFIIQLQKIATLESRLTEIAKCINAITKLLMAQSTFGIEKLFELSELDSLEVVFNNSFGCDIKTRKFSSQYLESNHLGRWKTSNSDRRFLLEVTCEMISSLVLILDDSPRIEIATKMEVSREFLYFKDLGLLTLKNTHQCDHLVKIYEILAESLSKFDFEMGIQSKTNISVNPDFVWKARNKLSQFQNIHEFLRGSQVVLDQVYRDKFKELKDFLSRDEFITDQDVVVFKLFFQKYLPYLKDSVSYIKFIDFDGDQIHANIRRNALAYNMLMLEKNLNIKLKIQGNEPVRIIYSACSKACRLNEENDALENENERSDALENVEMKRDALKNDVFDIINELIDFKKQAAQNKSGYDCLRVVKAILDNIEAYQISQIEAEIKDPIHLVSARILRMLLVLRTNLRDVDKSMITAPGIKDSLHDLMQLLDDLGGRLFNIAFIQVSEENDLQFRDALIQYDTELNEVENPGAKLQSFGCR